MKVLFVGLGGVGQRHVRNLRAILGQNVEILAWRVRRLSHVVTPTLHADESRDVERVYDIRAFETLAVALAEQPRLAFICNPTSLHGSRRASLPARGLRPVFGKACLAQLGWY